jgi:nucleoside-diphosphate-sugar epimerase
VEVIGRGFVARHLAGMLDRHPHVTVLAAGVSRTAVTARPEFEREATLVRDTLRRCRALRRAVVFLSTASASMYGSTERPATEALPVEPPTPYGRHKLELERAVAASGCAWLTLRLSHLVGHGQHPEQLLPALVAQVRSGTVRVRRGACRDLLDVRHMVRALDLLLGAGVCGMVVNLASGVPEPVERIVGGVEHRLGVSARRQVLDVGAAERTVVSIDRLRALVPDVAGFGFGPAYLPALLDRYVPSHG